MNFKDYAKKHTSGSSVLQGREKIETEALIAKYPDGVSITDFDFLDSQDGGRYVVCAFAENPELYFNGGKIMTELFEDIVSQFADLDLAREAYQNSPDDETIKVKLSHARSKKGNRYTKVEVVD